MTVALLKNNFSYFKDYKSQKSYSQFMVSSLAGQETSILEIFLITGMWLLNLKEN